MQAKQRAWTAVGALIAAVALAGSASSQNTGSQNAGAKAYEPPIHTLSPKVQEHLDLAYLIMNGDISSQHISSLLFSVNPEVFPNPLVAAAKLPPMPATKAFDQLIYLGVPTVSAWALNTSDGIILIDTLDNTQEAQTYIEGGLRSVGLDPARIKYILITHAHGDHYGGAKYLQEKYHPHVLMSTRDWAYMAETGARFGPPQFGLPPTHDMDVVDGQTLTLGKTTMRLYITPGHTPGTVSAIFPVTDKGRPHVVSFIGGTGLQSIDRDPKKGGFGVMRDAVKRFAKLSVDAGADALVANHPFTDGAYVKVQAIRDGKGGAASPWLAGKDAVLRFYVAFTEAIDAVETFYEENPSRQGPPPGVSPGGGPR